jgi:large subunit ribosomal protein L25
MEKIKLKLESRDSQKPNQLRAQGKIPATLYGPGKPSENVQIDEKVFSRLPATAFSHVIELETDAGPVNALIRQVQRRSTTHKPLNIELYRVSADHKLTITVPLTLIGESPAITAGGMLVEIYQEAEIECLPKDIPDSIEVDLSKILEIEQGLHFSDLRVPPGVEILNPPEEIIVRVVEPRVVTEEEKPATEEGTAGTAAEGAEGATASAEGQQSAASGGQPAGGAPAGKGK